MSRIEISSQDLARATRLLAVRSRREATGLFAGNYVSAFRGSGLEFEESRPYTPGEDIRTLDWNATARNGAPYTKRFREERNQTLLFGLDVSASMTFGTTGRSKAGTAVHALALVAAAAGRAGDRSGLVSFDDSVRGEVAIGRGQAHTWQLIRSAVAAGNASQGRTDLRAGLRGLQTRTRHRSVVVVISDFRDPRLFAAAREPAIGADAPTSLRQALARLARLHDVVAAVVVDPREEALPRAGVIRVQDPEEPGAARLLNTHSRRARARYRAACAAWRARLEAELRGGGAETLWLRTDQSPLYPLGRFFQERAGRRTRAVA